MLHSGTEDFLLESYSYDLPEELIAQAPALVRDQSRLLVLGPGETELHAAKFVDIDHWLPHNALLVVNNSKVLPARLFGKTQRGRNTEFLLLTPLPLLEIHQEKNKKIARVEGLLRGTKRCKIGEQIFFSEDFFCRLVKKSEFGRVEVDLEWQGELAELFQRHGQMPLPPYIRRVAEAEDGSRYQTVYASDSALGSVAAPTAGLHFTHAMREQLEASGRSWAELSLYVGYGTFSPVRVADIREHRMHPEYVEITAKTAMLIKEAKQAGRPVVAVGTTSLRAMEGVASYLEKGKEYKGWLDLFIYPGFQFRIVDQLITNFHLPGSSLLMLISALAGRKRVLDAYTAAIKQGFRFFSYGDAMLLRRD